MDDFLYSRKPLKMFNTVSFTTTLYLGFLDRVPHWTKITNLVQLTGMKATGILLAATLVLWLWTCSTIPHAPCGCGGMKIKSGKHFAGWDLTISPSQPAPRVFKEVLGSQKHWAKSIGITHAHTYKVFPIPTSCIGVVNVFVIVVRLQFTQYF